MLLIAQAGVGNVQQRAAVLQHGGLAGEVVGPAQGGLNFGGQHGQVKRLGDEIIRALVDGQHNV